jgi:multidrug resistance efflux pump
LRAVLLEQERQVSRLSINSPSEGTVVSRVDETQVGMFVPRGYPLATIVSGGWEARMVVDEDALKRSGISAGDELTFRSVTRPEELIPARVVSVLPSGSRRIAPLPLTHLGGGDIAVDPRTHEATQPFFEVRLALSPSAEEFVRGGMTGAVRLGTGAESIGHAVMRRVVRFWNRLVQEQ